MFIKNKDDMNYGSNYDALFDYLKYSKNDRKDYSIAMRKIKPGKKSREHIHCDSDEVYYVISGFGRLTVNNEEADVRQGDIVIIPQCASHFVENKSESDMEILVIGFTGNLYDGWNIWL